VYKGTAVKGGGNVFLKIKLSSEKEGVLKAFDTEKRKLWLGEGE
jgi:hypothetical protein